MILDQIVTSVRRNLRERKGRVPLSDLEGMAARRGPARGFRASLQGRPIAVIAEIKRASPSKGGLNPALDVAMLAERYARGGASAISVLTEPDFFKGSMADLAVASQSASLPVLRKDFIVDSYQVFEARAYGADAVLLIAAILSAADLAELMAAARQAGLDTLVEVHNELEVGKAVAAGGGLVGINNRNLANFVVDLDTTFRLRTLLPAGIDVVSESGINSRQDVVRLQEVGVRAVLIGEALVTAGDPMAKLRELLGDSGEAKGG